MPLSSSVESGTERAAESPRAATYDLNTPLVRLIEDAVGAEVSLFLADGPRLGAACQACAAGPTGAPDARLACGLVRDLAAGVQVDPENCPEMCDAGRVVRLHAFESIPGHALMVARPGENLEDDIDRRLAATAALWERCERLSTESEGLAQEVIRSYEQLNVIFDITQQICKARDAAEIKHFLIRRLAQTLQCDWACCLSAHEGLLWWARRPDLGGARVVAEVRDRHAQLLWQVCEGRTPLVHNPLPEAGETDPYALLVGTLGDPDTQPDILLLARSAGGPEFIYGDVMMIDSMLSHAQHVISNIKLVERLRTMSFGAVRALVSAIDKKDHYTKGHSERVGFLSHLIGQHMGLEAEQLQDLEWGGLLHDVGKIGIRDGILTKPAGLTPDEYDHIKEHVWMSHEIVAPIDCMSSVRDIVLYHHEVPDGSGYPKGLKGDEIPLLARIVHVADTFDALTTSRSYRKAFPVSKALAIMHKEKGPKLEPEIVDHFVQAFATFQAEQPDRFRQLFAHLEEEPT